MTLSEYINSNNSLSDYDKIELMFTNPIDINGDITTVIMRINEIPKYILDMNIGVVGTAPLRYIKDPNSTNFEFTTILSISVKN
jgi:hypothetical protein